MISEGLKWSKKRSSYTVEIDPRIYPRIYRMAYKYPLYFPTSFHYFPTCINNGQFVTRTQVGTFLEGNLARYINIEQMNLAMLGNQATTGVKDRTCVVQSVAILLWYGAPNQIDPMVSGSLG